MNNIICYNKHTRTHRERERGTERERNTKRTCSTWASSWAKAVCLSIPSMSSTRVLFQLTSPPPPRNSRPEADTCGA